MIDKQRADEIRDRLNKLNAWIDTIRSPKNGWASYKPEDKPPEIPEVSNSERSDLELFEFCANPPEKYFLYINQVKRIATTWTGEKLGDVCFGREYKSPAFGRMSVRVPISVYAVNGKKYHGTYFKSAGDYARIKRTKEPAP